MPKGLKELSTEELRKILEIEEAELAGLDEAKKAVGTIMAEEADAIRAQKAAAPVPEVTEEKHLDLALAEKDPAMRERITALLKRTQEEQRKKTGTSWEGEIHLADYEAYEKLQASAKEARKLDGWSSKAEWEWQDKHKSVSMRNRTELEALARFDPVAAREAAAKEAAGKVAGDFTQTEQFKAYQRLVAQRMVLKDTIKSKHGAPDLSDVRKNPAKYAAKVRDINAQLPEGQKIEDYFALCDTIDHIYQRVRKEAADAKEYAQVDWIDAHLSDERKDYRKNGGMDEFRTLATGYTGADKEKSDAVQTAHDAAIDHRKAVIATELLETEKLRELIAEENKRIDQRNRDAKKEQKQVVKANDADRKEKDYIDRLEWQAEKEKGKVLFLKGKRFALSGVRNITQGIGNSMEQVTEKLKVGIVKGRLQSEEDKLQKIDRQLDENRQVVVAAGKGMEFGDGSEQAAQGSDVQTHTSLDHVRDRMDRIHQLEKQREEQVAVRDATKAQVEAEVKDRLEKLTASGMQKATARMEQADLLKSRDQIESDVILPSVAAKDDQGKAIPGGDELTLEKELKMASISANEASRMRMEAQSTTEIRKFEDKKKEIDEAGERLKSLLKPENLDSIDKVIFAAQEMYNLYHKVKALADEEDEEEAEKEDEKEEDKKEDEGEEKEGEEAEDEEELDLSFDIDINQRLTDLREVAEKYRDWQNPEYVQKCTEIVAKAGEVMVLVGDKLDATVQKVNEQLERTEQQAEADRAFLDDYEEKKKKNKDLSVFDHKIEELEKGAEAAGDMIDVRREIVSESVAKIRAELAEREKNKEAGEGGKKAAGEEAPQDKGKTAEPAAEGSAAPAAAAEESEEHKRAREEYEAAMADHEQKEQAAEEKRRDVRHYEAALSELAEQADTLAEGQRIFNDRLTQEVADVQERFTAVQKPAGTDQLGTQTQIEKRFTKIAEMDPAKKSAMEAEIDKAIKARVAADKNNPYRTADKRLTVSGIEDYRKMEKETEKARKEALAFVTDKADRDWLEDPDRAFYDANLNWEKQPWSSNRRGIRDYAREAAHFEEAYQKALGSVDPNTEEGKKAMAQAAMDRYRAKLAVQLIEKNNIKDAITEENRRRSAQKKEETAEKEKRIAQADQAGLDEKYEKELRSASHDLSLAGARYYRTYLVNATLKGVSELLQDAVTTAAEAQIKAPAREMESRLEELREDKAELDKTADATARLNGRQMAVAKANTAGQNLQDPKLLKGIMRNAAEMSHVIGQRGKVETEIEETEKKLEDRRVAEKAELEHSRQEFSKRVGFDKGTVADKSSVAAIGNTARGEAVLKMLDGGQISEKMSQTLLRSVNLSQSAAMAAEATGLQALYDQEETIRRINEVSTHLSACFTEKGKGTIDKLITGAKALRSLAGMVTEAVATEGMSLIPEIPEEIDIKASFETALNSLDETIKKLKGEDGEKKEYTIDQLVEMTKAWQGTLDTLRAGMDQLEEERRRRYENHRVLKENAKRMYEDFHDRTGAISAPEFLDEQARLQRIRANELVANQLEAYRLAQESVGEDLKKKQELKEKSEMEAEASKQKLEEARANFWAVEEKELRAKGLSGEEIARRKEEFMAAPKEEDAPEKAEAEADEADKEAEKAKSAADIEEVKEIVRQAEASQQKKEEERQAKEQSEEASAADKEDEEATKEKPGDSIDKLPDKRLIEIRAMEKAELEGLADAKKAAEGQLAAEEAELERARDMKIPEEYVEEKHLDLKAAFTDRAMQDRISALLMKKKEERDNATSRSSADSFLDVSDYKGFVRSLDPRKLEKMEALIAEENKEIDKRNKQGREEYDRAVKTNDPTYREKQYRKACEDRADHAEWSVVGLRVKRAVINSASGVTGVIGTSVQGITDRLKLGIIKGALAQEEKKVRDLEEEIDENERTIVAFGKAMTVATGAEAHEQDADIFHDMEAIRDRGKHIRVLKERLKEQTGIRDEKKEQVSGEVEAFLDERFGGRQEQASEMLQESDRRRQRDLIESQALGKKVDPKGNVDVKTQIQLATMTQMEHDRIELEAKALKLDAEALKDKAAIDAASEKLKNLLTPENLDTVDKVVVVAETMWSLYKKVRSVTAEDDGGDDGGEGEEDEEEFDLQGKIKEITEAAGDLDKLIGKPDLIRKSTEIAAKAGELLVVVSGKLDESVRELDEKLDRAKQQAKAERGFMDRYEAEHKADKSVNIFQVKEAELREARKALDEQVEYRSEILTETVSALEAQMESRGILAAEVEKERKAKEAKEKPPETEAHKAAREASEKAKKEFEEKAEAAGQSERKVEALEGALEGLKKQTQSLKEGKQLINEGLTKQAEKVRATHAAQPGHESEQAAKDKDYEAELKSAAHSLNTAGISYLMSHIASGALRKTGAGLKNAVYAAAEAQIKAPGRELETRLKKLEAIRADIERTTGENAKTGGKLMGGLSTEGMSANVQDKGTLTGVAANLQALGKLAADGKKLDEEIAEVRRQLEDRRKKEAEELRECEAKIRGQLSFDRTGVQLTAETNAALNSASTRAIQDMLDKKQISFEMYSTLLRDANLSQTSAMTGEASGLKALHAQDETIQTISRISDSLSACFTEKGKKRIDMFVDGAKALGTLAGYVMKGVEIYENPGDFLLSIGTNGESRRVKEVLDDALTRLNGAIDKVKGNETAEGDEMHSIDMLVECTKAWQEALETFQKTFEAVEKESRIRYENRKIINAQAQRDYDAYKKKGSGKSAVQYTDDLTKQQKEKATEVLDKSIDAGEHAAEILETDLAAARKEQEEKKKAEAEAKKALDEAEAKLKALDEAEKKAPKAAETSAEKAAETPAAKAAETAPVKPAEKAEEKPAWKAAEKPAEKAAAEDQAEKDKEHEKQLETMLAHKDDEIGAVEYELSDDKRNGKQVIETLTGVDPEKATPEQLKEALRRINVNGLPAAAYFKKEIAGVSDPVEQAEKIGDMLKGIMHDAADPKSAGKIPQTIAVENEHFLLSPVRLRNAELEAARQALVDEVGVPGTLREAPQKPEGYNKMFHRKESREYDAAMAEYQKEAAKHQAVKEKWDEFHKEHDAGERALSRYNSNNRSAGEGYNNARVEAAKKEKKLGKDALQHAIGLHRGTRELPKEKEKGSGRTM